MADSASAWRTRFLQNTFTMRRFRKLLLIALRRVLETEPESRSGSCFNADVVDALYPALWNTPPSNIIYTLVILLFIFVSSAKCKLHRGRDHCLLCSLMYMKHQKNSGHRAGAHKLCVMKG